MEPSGTIHLTQKDQGKKSRQVNEKGENPKQEYLEQRARGAYIASICQPEAAYESVAAQHQEPTKADICALNRRLEWQMKHLDRRIKYIPLDLEHTKIFVFVDGSFANNKDLSSQIGYLIVIANENDGTKDSRLKAISSITALPKAGESHGVYLHLRSMEW